MIFIIGLVVYFLGAFLSSGNFEKNNPEASHLGLKPIAGSGDISPIFSAIQMLGALLMIAGIFSLCSSK